MLVPGTQQLKFWCRMLNALENPSMKEFVEKPDFYDASGKMGGGVFSHTHMSSG